MNIISHISYKYHQQIITHSTVFRPFICKVVHFWNILDTSWPDDCTDHRIFLPCYFFLDMICPGSCIAMTELSIYNTHFKSNQHKVIWAKPPANESLSFESCLLLSVCLIGAWLHDSQCDTGDGDDELTFVFWGLAEYFGWPALFWVNIINQRHLALV